MHWNTSEVTLGGSLVRLTFIFGPLACLSKPQCRCTGPLNSWLPGMNEGPNRDDHSELRIEVPILEAPSTFKLTAATGVIHQYTLEFDVPAFGITR